MLLKNAPTVDKVHHLFEKMWLARYQQPKKITFKNYTKFKAEFGMLIENMGLELNPSMSFNQFSIKCYSEACASSIYKQSLKIWSSEPLFVSQRSIWRFHNCVFLCNLYIISYNTGCLSSSTRIWKGHVPSSAIWTWLKCNTRTLT